MRAEYLRLAETVDQVERNAWNAVERYDRVHDKVVEVGHQTPTMEIKERWNQFRQAELALDDAELELRQIEGHDPSGDGHPLANRTAVIRRRARLAGLRREVKKRSGELAQTETSLRQHIRQLQSESSRHGTRRSTDSMRDAASDYLITKWQAQRAIDRFVETTAERDAAQARYGHRREFWGQRAA